MNKPLAEISRTYRISPGMLRRACEQAQFPCSSELGMQTLRHNQRKVRLFHIDDTTEDFLRWYANYQTTSQIAQQRREQTPILALGMFAAKHGIALVTFPRREDSYSIQKPLEEVLDRVEANLTRPDVARAASKERLLHLLRRNPPSVLPHATQSLEDYLTLFFEQVIGSPFDAHFRQRFWPNERRKSMIYAYTTAFRETLMEWWPSAPQEAQKTFEEMGRFDDGEIGDD